MLILDAIVSLAGLVAPPAFDFIKKKFIKPENDTTEATLSSLATTSPETIPAFLNAQVGWLKAKVDWFNRDVIGTPTQWVIDLRAAIRPMTVVACIGAVVYVAVTGEVIEDVGVRYLIETNVSSWFGSRLVKK